MTSTPPGGSPPVPLESVLRTEELSRRPSRPPDYERQSGALSVLTEALADSPQTVLQRLADTILDVCACGSAGISLLTDDGERFHWPAISGVWKPHIGGGTPRDFSPCGDVLDRDCPLLFTHVERRYAYFLPVRPPVEEALLVPFHVEGKAVGTIWAIMHDDRSTFDGEDLRLLVNLGTFASVAYKVYGQVSTLTRQAREGREAQSAMREMNQALLVSSVRQHELAEQSQLAQAALQRSERRYRRLFEASKDGVLILDLVSGRIIDANPFMSDLLGYSHDEFLGKELWEFGQLSDRSASQAAVLEIRENGYLRYEHLPLESNRGLRVEVEVIAHAYQEDRDRVIQCSIRDISERNRLQALLGEQATRLSDMHRRKDEFLAMLSHELRGPLAPIANAVQLLGLQRNDENQMQQQARRIIERQVGQLKHLVDDLLEVSRITTGKVQLRRETIIVGDIVKSAIETVRPLIEQRRHELTISLPPEQIRLDGDAARLEQVVANLLTNAAKYTEEGGHVWLSAQREGDECVLRVRDTGVGIPPTLLPCIFDLFTQEERSLDRSQGGLGVGLALVKRLTELHGGRVEASSTVGQGSEFVVHLPVLRTDSPPVPAGIVEIRQPMTRPLKVLIVDDHVDTVVSCSMLLKALGHDVQSVYDGHMAEQATLDYRPDVVLLDIGLPGLNGYEVAKRIRRNEVLRSVVLVAMTGYGQESDRQTSLQAGFEYHLVKPVHAETLQKVLTIVSSR